MTGKKYGARLTHIVVSDGLDTYDPIDYDAKNAPNTSEHDRFREYYEAKFLEIMDERDAFVEQLLNDHTVGNLTIEGLHKLLISAPEPDLYYAVKYMLHRKLVDHFREQGHTLSADREIYLLGQTWVEAKFMVRHREHALHGQKFPSGTTDKATEVHKEKAQHRADQVLFAARAVLQSGLGRKQNGNINSSKLAEEIALKYSEALNIRIGESRIAQIIKKHILSDKLK